jgi:hypothetical protein
MNLAIAFFFTKLFLPSQFLSAQTISSIKRAR